MISKIFLILSQYFVILLINILFYSCAFADAAPQLSKSELIPSLSLQQENNPPAHLFNDITLEVVGFLFVSLILFIFIWKYRNTKQQNRLYKESLTLKRHLGSLLNSSINEIYIFDKNSLKFLDVSKGAMENLGYTEAELKELTACDIKPEYSEESFRKLLKPLLDKEKELLVFETIHQRKNGSTYPVEVHLQLIEADADDSQFLAIILDITEKKRIERESKKANETIQKLSLAVEQSPNIIIITDAEGVIEYVNPEFTETTGYSRDEVLYKRSSVLKSGEMSQEVYKNLWRTILSGKTWVGLFHNRRKNGELYWDSAKVSPIKNAQGKITHFLGVQSDVTNEKQLEEQLRRSQKMDALGKLTGGIAHDYNNMLNVILGYTELMEMFVENGDIEKIKEYIKEIQNASDRGARLTKRLLTFSRTQSTEPEIVSLNEVLHNIHDMLSKTLTARIQLEYELAESTWPIYLDKGDLEDAILNLCINAMHAMEEGGSLVVSTYNQHLSHDDAVIMNLTQGDYVQLALRDTGCGIEESILDKIFDPFFTTKGDLGTGLGLTQVYGFVKRAKGAFTIDSSVNAGTYISLYFPRYFSKANSEAIVHNNDVVEMGKETLLVVDDEEALRSLAYELLSSRGYTVLLAENGIAALNILAENAVDLMISDVVMPNMDGYKLSAKVREDYPEVKIQLISGYHDDRSRTEEDEILNASLLHKPFKAKSLYETVRKRLDED